MNPTSRELIEAIAEALRTDIAPLVEDQPWPASELRTIDALLAHLAMRVELEHEMLIADDADLDAVLTALGEHLPIVVDVAPGASLASGNLARRGALEAAIHLIHDGDHAPQVELVRAYLVRAAARDAPIYGPLGQRSLF